MNISRVVETSKDVVRFANISQKRIEIGSEALTDTPAIVKTLELFSFKTPTHVNIASFSSD